MGVEPIPDIAIAYPWLTFLILTNGSADSTSTQGFIDPGMYCKTILPI